LRCTEKKRWLEAGRQPASMTGEINEVAGGREHLIAALGH
jgi:hypothetical protein